MATAEEYDVNFNDIPMEALGISLRLKLSNMLDPELPIFERDQYARDYRGLAELMGCVNNDLMLLRRNANPTMAVLNGWGSKFNVAEFLKLLESIQRYDVIDDLKRQIISNCKTYLTIRSNQPLQDSEVSSCIDSYDRITIYDTNNHVAHFDAYVCYADHDLEFVKRLADHLEGSGNGIKLCIRDRDLVCGNLEYDAFVRLIHERCNRILIILTPDFLNCPECDYQAKYAASLASEHRNRRLIPIVFKHCEIPAVLKYISKVDFSRTDIQEWIWKKLIHSIKTPADELFVPSSTTGNELPINSEHFAPPSVDSLHLPDVPTHDLSQDLPSTSTAENLYPSLQIGERVALVESTGGARSRGSRLVQRFRKIMSSPSSSGSSGFHSQSDA